ncbi:hypothetical protein AAFP30_28355 [Gordonia sp. CPCC 205515]|uniref:hypothetical protein n=1 Tax=Gordonia sp. CPCC 205515 TaxID=3140791 RepID=UPI003AF34DDD
MDDNEGEPTMRKPLIVAIGGAVCLVLALILALSGVIPLSTSGQAVASAPTRAQHQLNDATLPMADAPAAQYSGEMAVDGRTLAVQDLTVTAAGDVSGKIAVNQQPAEVLELDGTTYVKAGAGFWEAWNSDGPDNIRRDSTGAAGNWAMVPPGFFGVDLGTLLRPSSFALTSQDQDDRIQPDAPTTPVAAGDQTPDRRGTPTGDPADIRIGPMQDDGQTIVAGQNPVRLNPDGTIYGIAGPVRTAPADRPTTSKLKVTLLSNDGVTEFYATVQGLKDPLSKVAAPEVNVPKPVGNLDNCTNTYCLLVYNFSNSMPGADRGTVTIVQTSSLTVNGAPAGTCTRTTTMKMNGTGMSQCVFTFADPRTRTINYHADSNFTISATAEKDVTVIVQSAERGRDVATKQPGHWFPVGYKLDPNARRFNQQITGNPSGFAYLVGDVPFDGRETDGTLLMTAAPGYDSHVSAGGVFDPAWPGTAQLLDQAKKAAAAGEGQPVRWVFAEQRSAGAASKLLADNGISGIQVVTVPLAGA